jgi:hypothetical protein
LLTRQISDPFIVNTGQIFDPREAEDNANSSGKQKEDTVACIVIQKDSQITKEFAGDILFILFYANTA